MHATGETRPSKPLGHKSYGSIGHLPGSRMDVNHTKYATGKVVGKDFGVHAGQAAICTTKVRDQKDRVYVQEKLDGSNVAVANIDGVLVALSRSGYEARTSPYVQHHIFADWVAANLTMFDFLKPGERVAGEWLAQAHGTRYALTHEPFVAFDIMRNGHERATYDEVLDRTRCRLVMPQLIAENPITVEGAMFHLGRRGWHGALDPAEGCVWRVERDGKVDFLAKYVRPDKVDGCYLPEVSGKEAIWNWKP
jgi:hypothetical protein